MDSCIRNLPKSIMENNAMGTTQFRSMRKPNIKLPRRAPPLPKVKDRAAAITLKIEKQTYTRDIETAVLRQQLPPKILNKFCVTTFHCVNAILLQYKLMKTYCILIFKERLSTKFAALLTAVTCCSNLTYYTYGRSLSIFQF